MMVTRLQRMLSCRCDATAWASTWVAAVAAIQALQPAARRIVGPVNCPPTYEQMFVLVDSNGRNISPKRPPGYIDPHDVVLDEYQLVGADSGALRATASQGTSNLHFACGGHRGANGRWRASCARPLRSISALPSKSSLQATRVISAHTIAVEWPEGTRIRRSASRFDSRSLAAEPRR